MEYKIVQSQKHDALWHHIAEHYPRLVRWMEDPNDPGDYHCFVAVQPDGTFMGLCVVDIGPMRFGPLAQITGCLENVLVLEPYRRRGVGTALVRTAFDAAWERDAEHVWWMVGYEGEELAFYRSLGLVFLSEEDPQAEHPEKLYRVVAVNPRTITKQGEHPTTASG